MLAPTSPGTFTTGSNGFRGSALFIMRAGAQAPGEFTTGSEWVPMDSEAVHFSRCVLALGSQAHLPLAPNGFQLQLYTYGVFLWQVPVIIPTDN